MLPSLYIKCEMKYWKYILCLALGSLTFTFSCKKVGGNKTINYKFQNEFKVDTISLVGEREFVGFSTATDIEKYLSMNDFTINNVKEAKVLSVEISTINANQDLNYFKRLSLRMSNDAGAQLIFANAELPDETTKKLITFTPESMDLKEFIKQPSIQFTLLGTNDLPILASPVDLKIIFNIEVKAGLGN